MIETGEREDEEAEAEIKGVEGESTSV